MTIPTHVPIVVTVTPQAAPSITINDIVVSGINQPAIAYTHTQGTSSATWVINHNLGWNPNVTVQDSAYTTVEGNVSYTNINSLTVTFSGAFSGKAYLS
jgi:hypothetical protein